ncbi:MAG: N-acetylmuramoyl-L-alanine amidase [Sandarakinorhabdus sp.]|nr:N-acetylmuramoyl-L-alanine amidase [Sandarakinorhabdus sp.]
MLLILLAAATPAFAARITAVTIAPGVVTLTTDAPIIAAHTMALSDPDRLVIDVPALLTGPLTGAGAGSVSGLRGAMFAPGIARLVIDLAGPLEIVSAKTDDASLVLTLRRIPPATFAEIVKRGRRPLPVLTAPGTAPPRAPADEGFELPTTMFGAPPSPTIPSPTTPSPTPPSRTPAALPPVPLVIPPLVAGPQTPAVLDAAPPTTETPPSAKSRAPGVRARSGGKPLVVIDAGHGGKDVGATSINGAYEKAVTLAIAREAARLLEKSGRLRVKLTRADDRFIPLGGRVAIARAARADLFISIHADAALNAEARGASVYTLSAVASDAVAARLAARENKADIIGGVNLGVEAPEVGDIMIDLSRRATTNVSVAFAEILQDELSSRMPFRGEFHHFAGFYVLKAPDVPSVLLETGYVTNGDDSDFLFSDSGRRRVAQGIAHAIERHLLGD